MRLLAAVAHFQAGFFPLIAILQPQQMVQVGGNLFVVLSASRLPFQRRQPRPNFGEDVVKAFQIVLRFLQAAQGFSAAIFVMVDAGSFLKQRPPFFCP